ncbi:MAG: iron-containing alcohol dehydrogenase, partial [Planctomycetota bacterium]|nr:iron-containing alcohol dehydrogenase [Planctomycetota bacterium]
AVGQAKAHGVAPALGVHCRVPHGVACALMLPVALRVNRRMRLGELALLGRNVLGLEPAMPDEEVVDAFIDRIDSLCQQVGVPRRLSEVGVTAEQIPAIVASSRGSSMSGNPRQLSDEELTAELEGIL